MATATTAVTNFLFKQHSSTLKVDPFSSNTLFLVPTPTLPKPLPATIALQRSHKEFSRKAITTAAKKGTSTSTGRLALCEREKIERVPRFDFYKNGDDHSAVIQLHSREDVENLVEEHRTDNKLIVLDVGLKDCRPCVRGCMQFLKDMKIVRVPTFLFIRDGDVCGRYVGSCKAELIREVLKYRWRS
ncbi:hypothetical protein MKW94_003336 [Papaver nudicaule]|uniref:Thioredoxin-like protein n=1 Tax=Papaver nudicaule TaxID=74823 RepID=A0AA42AWS1_PAPNU|nr:hypothetical protein [Papaver nudicaule]